MTLEDRYPSFGNADWATPAFGEGHAAKLRMQAANPVFEAGEGFGGRARFNTKRIHFTPIGKVDEAAAKNDLLTQKTTPKIWEIHGIEGFPFTETDFLQGGVGEIFSGDGEGETRFGALLPASYFAGVGVGGKQDLPRAENPQRRMQEKRSLKFATLNVGMFEEKSAGALRSSGQSGNDLSGINCAAGDFVNGAQLARVAPANRRILKRRCATEFIHAGKVHVAFDAQFVEDFLVSGQHVAESRQIPPGRFSKGHAAGVAAGP